MDFAHLTYCMVFLFFFFQGLLRICGNRCGCPGSKARKGELMFDFSHYKKWMYLQYGSTHSSQFSFSFSILSGFKLFFFQNVYRLSLTIPVH